MKMRKHELRGVEQQAEVREHPEDGRRLRGGGPGVDVAHRAVGIEEHHQQHGIRQVDAAQKLRRLCQSLEHALKHL